LEASNHLKRKWFEERRLFFVRWNSEKAARQGLAQAASEVSMTLQGIPEQCLAGTLGGASDSIVAPTPAYILLHHCIGWHADLQPVIGTGNFFFPVQD
jgi:hypothetical protein